tara:strand:+ start:465 stop:773 length:309 start_codon:yes stop_codon:yes gene_type:complete
MKNKKQTSPNWLTCNISGEKRMSNKTYIADKAYKNGIGTLEWKDNYINKASLVRVVAVVQENGMAIAADEFGVSTGQIVKWLRFNGRGKYVATQPKQLEKVA